MPIGTAAAIGLGLAGAGSAAGAIAGAGDKTVNTTRNVAPASAAELALQQDSMRQYNYQKALADQYQAGINGPNGSQQMQDQARQFYGNVLNGNAFNANPQQDARINAIRDAQVNLGSQDINKFLQQNLTGLSQQAGVRGLRGQAYSELQGQELRGAGEQMGKLVGGANLTAAQQQYQSPYQMLAAQTPYAMQGMTLADQQMQQAIANRQALQNPVMLQNYLSERTGAAGSTQTTPGSFGGAVGGALAGFGGGLNTGMNLGEMFRGDTSGSSGSSGGSNGYTSSNFTMPQMGSQFGQPVGTPQYGLGGYGGGNSNMYAYNGSGQ